MTKYLIIFMALTFVYSCNQNPQKATQKKAENSIDIQSDAVSTIITGEIENPTNDFVVLLQNSLSDTAYLDKHNNFTLEINITSGNYYQLSNGNRSINVFVEPGKNLHISYNSKDIFNSIEFAGDGAEPNIYIKDRYLLMLDQTIPLVHLYEYPISEFKHIVDSVYVINKMYLDEFILVNPNTSELFKATELASIKYDRATKLIEYLNTNKLDPGTKYMRFLDKLSANDSSLLSVYEYKMFLNELIIFYANKTIGNSSLLSYEITLIKMQSVINYITNQKVINYMMYYLLKEQVKYYGYKNSEKLFVFFDKNCKDKQYREALQKPYKEYSELTNKPKAPQINMTNISGEAYGLNTFKGKYIYIDVWATWCLPCRKQLPYFESLKQKFKHKDIAFISISIDKKRSDWLEYLKIKNLSNNQFIVKDIEAFLNSYMIKTIPRFLIIDDRGNLIDINANSPSNIDEEWFNNLPNK